MIKNIKCEIRGLSVVNSFLNRKRIQFQNAGIEATNDVLREAKQIAKQYIINTKQSTTPDPKMEDNFLTETVRLGTEVQGTLYISSAIEPARARAVTLGYAPHFVALYKPDRERLRDWALTNLGYVPGLLWVGEGSPGAASWNAGQNAGGMDWRVPAYNYITRNFDDEYRKRFRK